MDIKYINHGVFFTTYIEGENNISLRFDGYFYNTKIVDLYFFFDRKNPSLNYTSIDFRDGGYHSSPYTTKAITKFVDFACDWVNNNFGDQYINDCMAYAYRAITDMYELYRRIYRKCNGNVQSEITFYGHHYQGHFGFNY